jgi:hypothetical protein
MLHFSATWYSSLVPFGVITNSVPKPSLSNMYPHPRQAHETEFPALTIWSWVIMVSLVVTASTGGSTNVVAWCEEAHFLKVLVFKSPFPYLLIFN